MYNSINKITGFFPRSGVDLEAEKLKTHQNGHKSKADKKKHGKPALETLHEVFDSLSAVEEVESYSFGDALRYTNSFSGRQVRPTPWNGLLEIGETLKIPVVMFSRVILTFMSPVENTRIRQFLP